MAPKSQKKKTVAQDLPAKLNSIIHDSPFYLELLNLERRIDNMIARKCISAHGALARIPATPAILRLGLSHYVSALPREAEPGDLSDGDDGSSSKDKSNVVEANDMSEDDESVGSHSARSPEDSLINRYQGHERPVEGRVRHQYWIFKLQGQILDGHTMLVDPSNPPHLRLSNLLKKLVIELDGEGEGMSKEQLLVWTKTESPAVADAFEVKRAVDLSLEGSARNVTLRVSLWLDHSPARFKVGHRLAHIMGGEAPISRVETRNDVIQGVWQYIHRHRLKVRRPGVIVVCLDTELARAFGLDPEGSSTPLSSMNSDEGEGEDEGRVGASEKMPADDWVLDQEAGFSRSVSLTKHFVTVRRLLALVDGVLAPPDPLVFVYRVPVFTPVGEIDPDVLAKMRAPKRKPGRPKRAKPRSESDSEGEAAAPEPEYLPYDDRGEIALRKELRRAAAAPKGNTSIFDVKTVLPQEWYGGLLPECNVREAVPGLLTRMGLNLPFEPTLFAPPPEGETSAQAKKRRAEEERVKRREAKRVRLSEHSEARGHFAHKYAPPVQAIPAYPQAVAVGQRQADQHMADLLTEDRKRKLLLMFANSPQEVCELLMLRSADQDAGFADVHRVSNKIKAMMELAEAEGRGRIDGGYKNMGIVAPKSSKSQRESRRRGADSRRGSDTLAAGGGPDSSSASSASASEATQPATDGSVSSVSAALSAEEKARRAALRANASQLPLPEGVSFFHGRQEWLHDAMDRYLFPKTFIPDEVAIAQGDVGSRLRYSVDASAVELFDREIRPLPQEPGKAETSSGGPL